MLDGTARVPVSLRGGAFSCFLPDHEVTVSGGEVAPIDHEGYRYVFSHVASAGSYVAPAAHSVYVFLRLAPETG